MNQYCFRLGAKPSLDSAIPNDDSFLLALDMVRYNSKRTSLFLSALLGGVS
jgi:hypothetical protein